NGANNTVTGLSNTTWSGTPVSGRAATEDQLKTIADRVANAGWKATSGITGSGTQSGTQSVTSVGSGDTVTFNAGDNLDMNQNGATFTYSLKPTLTGLTSAAFTDGTNTTTVNGSGVTAGGVSLTNSGINAGNKVISNVASGGTTATNAANIGDVQNAVANLSQNLTVTDGTNSGTVNLKNQSLKVAGANGITTNMNGQTLTVGLDSTTNNKVNDTATAVGRTISLGGDTGTTTAKSLTTGDVNFGIKSGNGYLTTAANGNDVTLTVNEGAVKDAAVSAVTVSTDAATDNPVTITPTTGTNSKDYKITVDTSKLAQKTNLAYTADNGTGGTTSLSQGLTFKDGTLTTATAGANGTITYDVKKGTLANTGGTVSVTGNDGVATAQNVADMINNATTSVSTLNIADGGTGTGSVNLKNQTLKVTGSNGLTTTASGQVIDVALDATTKNKIDNAADKDLSNLSTTGTQKIKDAAAFKVKANGDAGDDVKGGDEVNFKDGQNIKVSRTGKEFTIATADDVSFNKVTAADSVLVGTGTNLITLDGTTGTVTGNIFKAGSVNVNGANNTVTGLSNTTWSGTPVSGRAATEDQLKTIADRVANAGWKATSGITGSGTQSGTQSVTSVGSGDTVTFNAGDNLDMNQNGATFTYSLKPTLTGLTSAAFTDGTNTTTVNGSGVTAGGVSLTNSGINAGNKVISNVASGGTTATNAANIGDVQNAVANLSQNLTVTDGTNSGTVNLKNQSLKVAGANGITTNMNGQTLTVGLDSTTNNKVNDTATAVGRTISLGGDTGTTTAKSLTTGDVNFGIKSGNGYLTTAANGNDVTLTVNEGAVKDAAVSAVTVSTDAATDNPVTITPTTGTNSKDYKITVDTSKLAQKTNLAYTADNGTGGTTSLSQGLTFKDGTLTTATAGANGTITYDVKKGTLANTGGTVSVTGNDGVATAQNVADMINNATTSVSTLNIADGGTGTGSVNLKNQTLKVTGSNGLTTTASGQVIDVALDATTKNKIDNAADKDLSNLSTTGTQKIKDAAAFKVKANGDAGDDVKGGDEVNFKDGQNIKVSRTGKEFTIATADDVSFNKVTAADSVLVGTGTNLITLDGTTGTVTGNIFKAGSVNVNGANNTVTGLSNTTWSGTPVSGRAATEDQLKTIADRVANAGWKATSGITGSGTQSGTQSVTSVGSGDTVTFNAGDNLDMNQNGATFTYSLKPTLTGLTSAAFTDGTNTTTVNGSGVTAGGVSLTNSGINAGNKVISNVASGGTTATNAANIGDVQNAVANLSQNLTVTDGTNSGTVNLKNQSLKVAGANGITTNMNGQTLTVGLDSTTNNKVNDTATAVGRTISLGGDTGTTTAKSLTTGDVNFGIKSGNGYLTTAANGNDVTLTVNEGAVKDAAVSAVTVSTDAATDNPVTITPTTGTNSKDYKITVDTSKLAQKTNLAYTADNGTGGTTSLSQGLTFKDGTLTTATAGANGTITYDVKKGTLANTGGTVSVTGNDGVATAQNVADMINNATTSVSTLNIADGGTGTGSVNLKNQTLKVTGSNGLTTTASGQVIDVALDATTKNKIDNAADKDLSNLSTTGTQKIKDAAAFKVKANGDAGDDVKGGDEVNFKDGQNIKVSRTGKEFTIATADDVSFNKVTAADSVLVGTGTNLITLDGTTGTVTGNIFKAGSVNVNGANNTVTGLSNTTWSGTPVSGRAATEDQLKQVADDARAAAGSSKTVVTANSGEGANSTTGNISLTSTTAANGQVTYDVKLADKVTVGTAGNAVTVDGTTGKVTAKDGDFSNKVTVGTGSNKVTVDGADGSVTANTVKAGNVTVNGSNNTITGLSNTTWSGTTTTPDRAATEGQLKQVADAAKSAVDNVTMKYDGDNGGTQTLALKNGTFNVNGDGQFTETTANATGIQVKVKEAAVKDAAVSAVTVSTDTSNLNNPITVTATPGSHSMDYKVTFDGTKAAQSTNLSYKANGGSAETVSLSTGLNFKDGNLTTASVAPNGDVKYDVKTATIAVNNGMAGLNGNDGVATAQNVVDAMNAISHQTTGGLERVVNRIGAVESEGRRVAAQSAALAALKPIQYDPLEPNQIMAGIGNYRGETAAAVGLAHYANEDTMLHMGVALGDNNNMVNVGVTHKFGSAAKKAAIPDRYKAGPISSVYVMQDEVTQLRAENAQQKATLTKQQEEIDALKAAVAQLMAKQ
ncbi:MAG: YadA-like family protein, partial [Megasphaera micronuciformis]|nr:YadA-like family protein [Megasphaera micronuciformis]